MKKKLLLVLITSICGIAAQASAARLNARQETTTSASAQATQLQPGTVIYAELSKPIDTKRAKVGDPIVAKVTQPVLSSGKLVIPKNSKITGHITSAKAHTKDQPISELGIALDRAELKDGTQIRFAGITIQAMGGANVGQPPLSMTNGTSGSDARAGGPTGGTSPMRGSYPAPAPGRTNDSAATDTGPSTGSPRLNAASHGVIGMSGIRLQPQSQGGVLAEDGKNLKLDSGTQLLLRTR